MFSAYPPKLSTLSLSCSSSPLWPGRRSLSEDLLRPGSTVCADGGDRPCRVRLPGKVSTLLCAGVWLGRQVLREPLRGLPHRLPGEETDLCGAQQGLLLQRYHLTVALIDRAATCWHRNTVQQGIHSYSQQRIWKVQVTVIRVCTWHSSCSFCCKKTCPTIKSDDAWEDLKENLTQWVHWCLFTAWF